MNEQITAIISHTADRLGLEGDRRAAFIEELTERMRPALPGDTRIGALNLAPGDALVLLFDGAVSAEAAANVTELLQAMMTSAFGFTPNVLVLGDGAKICKISRAANG